MDVIHLKIKNGVENKKIINFYLKCIFLYKNLSGNYFEIHFGFEL